MSSCPNTRYCHPLVICQHKSLIAGEFGEPGDAADFGSRRFFLRRIFFGLVWLRPFFASGAGFD
jgi:hypothetical protein